MEYVIKRGLGIQTNLKIDKTTEFNNNSFDVSGNFKEKQQDDLEVLECLERSPKNNFDKEHFFKAETKIYEINGDFVLNYNLVGSSQLLLLVKNNSNIKLKVEGEGNFVSSGIHILTKENVDVSVFLDLNLKGDQNYIKLTQEQSANSNLKFGAVINTNNQTVLHSQADFLGENSSIDKRIFFNADNSDVDGEVVVNHLNGKTESNLVVNGVVKNSRIINENTVFIPANASSSKGYEHSKFVLMDEDSSAVSIPNLKILTNDVACSHGSTISRINDEEIFYLQTRGLSRSQSEDLIIRGLQDSVIDHVRVVEE